MQLRAVLRIVVVGITVAFAGAFAAAEERSKAEIVPQIPHAVYVKAVAFSSDGRHVLTGSQDWTVKMWDVENGALLRTFDAHKSQVDAVTFSQDGTKVLSGSLDKTLKLWDAATGQLLRTLEGHTGGVNSVAFSFEGSLVLSGSSDNTIKLWDAATGRLLRQPKPGRIDNTK